MVYYSIMRPVAPGTYPKGDGVPKVTEIVNFDEKKFVQEIDRDAWGYLVYDGELPEHLENDYELVPCVPMWYGVVCSSKKHGGGIMAIVEQRGVRAAQRPEDRSFETHAKEFRVRYFKGFKTAQRARETLLHLDVVTERRRSSVTQGCCDVYVNGEKIVTFGDRIVITGKKDRDGFYGEDIGGWMSTVPDSAMTLGVIWRTGRCPGNEVQKELIEKFGDEAELIL